jgi:hypothetical protein
MMFYLGIDQHARQITISLRDENGDVLLACQVSTQPDKIKAFFQKLTRERLGNGDTFVAVLEVCGFNDWLIGAPRPLAIAARRRSCRRLLAHRSAPRSLLLAGSPS